MPDTYTQIYVHVVFSVKERAHLLPPHHRDEIHKYIGGIIRARGHTMIAINSMPDHVHILLSLHPDAPLSYLVRDIKSASTHFINARSWLHIPFRWQDGYGAFSHSRAQLPIVARYIREQEHHHARKSFRTEFIDLLKRFEIEFDEHYLLGWEEEAVDVEG